MEAESASTILDRFVMSQRMNEIMPIKAIIIKSNVGESMINPRGKQRKNKIATKTKFILCDVLMLMKVPKKNAYPNKTSNVISKYRVASFLLTMLSDICSSYTYVELMYTFMMLDSSCIDELSNHIQARCSPHLFLFDIMILF